MELSLLAEDRLYILTPSNLMEYRDSRIVRTIRLYGNVRCLHEYKNVVYVGISNTVYRLDED